MRYRNADAGSPSGMASLVVVSVCLMLGAISALEARHVSVTHGFPLAWSLVLASTTPKWLLLALVLPFVLRLAIRTPLVPVRGAVVALHISVFLALSLSQALVDAWALGLASWAALTFSWVARVLRSWYSTMPTMVSMYVAVLVTAWGMSEARERQRRTLRASQLEAQLQTARLASLRAQLQPHFLYNTLNGIAALVADLQPARAVAAIEQLGELLHASLRDDAREEITVAEEVALAERYLALQGMRFGDRLRLVPDGPRTSGHGVGLSATRARLLTAYGERATLSLLPREGGGVIVRILVPRSLRSTTTVGDHGDLALVEAT